MKHIFPSFVFSTLNILLQTSLEFFHIEKQNRPLARTPGNDKIDFSIRNTSRSRHSVTMTFACRSSCLYFKKVNKKERESSENVAN
jgi:hypothetical protein